MSRIRRDLLIPMAFLACLGGIHASVAEDCDPPPPVSNVTDGPISWATTGSQGASGTCYQYVNTGPNAGRIRGLLCPNRKLSPPHGVLILPMGVVQGWNSCADAYLGNDCPAGSYVR
jgi:hypothetical protein